MLDYDGLAAHRMMVRDAARVEAFRAAIAALAPGKVVLDAGAGSGILSLLAAQAGAVRVYAVEAGPAAETAAALVAANGMGDRVTVIRADVASVELPEPVDLIVSEWMGSIGVDENLLGMVLAAKARWLKPDGVMVPHRVTVMAAPVALAQRLDSGFFGSKPWGLELVGLAEASVHELLMYRRRIVVGDLLGEPVALWMTQPSMMTQEQALLPARGEGVVQLTRDGMMNGLALWFEADMGAGVMLRTGPMDPDTHWGQLQLPMLRAEAGRAGDMVRMKLAAIPLGVGPQQLAWSVWVGDAPGQHQDTRIAPKAVEDEAVVVEAGADLEGVADSGVIPYLAQLAHDPDAYGAYLADPRAAMAAAGISDGAAAALLSGDERLVATAILGAGL